MPPDTLSGMGRPKKAEPTVSFRVPESFARRVRRLAAHFRMDPGDYLAERYQTLDKDEKKMLEDIAKEREGE